MQFKFINARKYNTCIKDIVKKEYIRSRRKKLLGNYNKKMILTEKGKFYSLFNNYMFDFYDYFVIDDKFLTKKILNNKVFKHIVCFRLARLKIYEVKNAEYDLNQFIIVHPCIKCKCQIFNYERRKYEPVTGIIGLRNIIMILPIFIFKKIELEINSYGIENINKKYTDMYRFNEILISEFSSLNLIKRSEK